MHLGFFPRVWLAMTAAILLPLAYLCFQPIEKVPVLPVFRGVGSPFLLIRQSLPESYSGPLGTSCLILSGGIFAFLYFTSQKRKEEAIPVYYREISRRRAIQKTPDQSSQHNAGSRPSSGDSPAPETQSSSAPRG